MKNIIDREIKIEIKNKILNVNIKYFENHTAGNLFCPVTNVLRHLWSVRKLARKKLLKVFTLLGEKLITEILSELKVFTISYYIVFCLPAKNDHPIRCFISDNEVSRQTDMLTLFFLFFR